MQTITTKAKLLVFVLGVSLLGSCSFSQTSIPNSVASSSSGSLANSPSTSGSKAAPTPSIDVCADLAPIPDEWLTTWAATNGAKDFQISIRDIESSCVYQFGNSEINFQTASTVKFMIAVALLEQVSKGEVQLDQVKSDLREMLTISSNSATNRLWKLAGGKSAIEHIALDYQLNQTAPGKSWGTTKTSATDQVKLLAAILPVKPESLTYQTWVLLKVLMGSVVEAQRWGVGYGLPDGWVGLVKNGWYHTAAGDEGPTNRSRINTIGVVQDRYGRARWIWAGYSNTWQTDQQGIDAWNQISTQLVEAWATR